METFSQIMIFGLGGLTIFLLAQKNRWQRYGYIVGLISEGFWFYTALTHHQTGILALVVLYIIGYLIGIKNYFIKK